MGVLWLFTSNLTSWVTTELWISRTCLFLSFAIMAPTIVLIILDAILWVFRASEQRGRRVVKMSRSGIALAVEHTRRLSEGAFSPAAAAAAKQPGAATSAASSSTSIHLPSERDRARDAAKLALSSLDDLTRANESAVSTGQNTPTDVRQRAAKSALPKEWPTNGGKENQAAAAGRTTLRPLGQEIA